MSKRKSLCRGWVFYTNSDSLFILSGDIAMPKENYFLESNFFYSRDLVGLYFKHGYCDCSGTGTFYNNNKKPCNLDNPNGFDSAIMGA